MKLHCPKCQKDMPILVIMSGPHLKAICFSCKTYIKFLSKTDKTQLEKEEDDLVSYTSII
jgi:formate dehydrogenase maturation protein FdhE